MKTFCSSTFSRRIALAAFTLTLMAAFAFGPAASAQEGAKSETGDRLEPATVTPYAEFQNSTLTGTTSTITVSNLPIVTGSGTIIYDNATIQFNVSSTGILTVGSTQFTAAPSVDVNAFEAGNYGLANNGGTQLVISGPGVTNGGSTEWSLDPNPGASCAYPNMAAWYVGPVKSSPYYTRILAAGVPLTGFSYGISGTSCGNSADWESNSLLGFSQTGSQISIVSFTANGVDQSQQVAQVSYSLQQ
jgi:hypothetical protein